MTEVHTAELDVLHGLRIRGLSPAEGIVETTGLDPAEVQEVLDAAVVGEQVRHRTGGRVQGYALTAAGRERHAELSERAVSADQRAALEPAYESFLEPNRALKETTTVWQTEADGDIAVVLPRLEKIHAQVSDVLVTAASALPRMRTYQPRFERALAAFRAGDASALARPMSGSYHDVWMELHEDLIVTLGRERSDADE